MSLSCVTVRYAYVFVVSVCIKLRHWGEPSAVLHAVYRAAYDTRAEPCVMFGSIYLLCVLLYQCCPTWQMLVCCSVLTATIINEHYYYYYYFCPLVLHSQGLRNYQSVDLCLEWLRLLLLLLLLLLFRTVMPPRRSTKISAAATTCVEQWKLSSAARHHTGRFCIHYSRDQTRMHHYDVNITQRSVSV